MPPGAAVSAGRVVSYLSSSELVSSVRLVSCVRLEGVLGLSSTALIKYIIPVNAASCDGGAVNARIVGKVLNEDARQC